MARRLRWVLASVAAVALLGALSPAAASSPPFRSTRNVAPDRTITWLDTGDSYASGEGATGATGYCQQSANAFGPKAATLLRTAKKWSIDAAPMTACTSHRADDLFNSPLELAGKPVGAPPERGPGVVPDAGSSLWEWGQATSDVDRFDVVTMSFGGNNVDFGKLITDCQTLVPTDWGEFFSGSHQTGCETSEKVLTDRIQAFTGGTPFEPMGPADSPAGGRNGSLVDFYKTVADTMVNDKGVLVVVGYPRLFTPSKHWGRWRGGRCNTVHSFDADMLGNLAVLFDERLRAAVATADGGRGKIRYVSRLEIFDDDGQYKSLCGDGVEWLNSIMLFLRDGTLRKDRGFHPNDLGNVATAERVAGEVDGVVGAPPPTTTTARAAQPAPTTEPTIKSDEQTYEIGSNFSATCTLAWPFAPARGREHVQFRTTCPAVPKQFLFVDVVYVGDLDLRPSKPQVRINGVVADIIRSEYGFTTLVVEADEVLVK